MPRIPCAIAFVALLSLPLSAFGHTGGSGIASGTQEPVQLADVQDDAEASLKATLARDGDMIQQMHDNAAKLELYNRAIDALQETVNEQSSLQSAVDYAMNFVPMMSLVARTGNVPGAPIDSTDLPSTRENKEANYLWGLPVNQFERILPTTFENFGKQFGGAATNLTEALKVAKQYRDGGRNVSDATAANLWDAGSVLYGLLLLSFLTWFLWRRLRLSTQIAVTELSADIQVVGVRTSKAIALCTVVIALAMFVLPPTNRALGAMEIFDGWHPLWTTGYVTTGYVEDQWIVRSIAFPILLCQWGLLALCAVVISVLRRSTRISDAGDKT